MQMMMMSAPPQLWALRKHLLLLLLLSASNVAPSHPLQIQIWWGGRESTTGQCKCLLVLV
jgi:hypothetical protein